MNKRKKELTVLKVCIAVFGICAGILIITGLLSMLHIFDGTFHIIPCIVVIALLIIALIPYTVLRRSSNINDDSSANSADSE